MADEELLKLKIEKGAGKVTRRRKRWIVPFVVLAVLVVGGFLMVHRSAVPVETVTVARAYPSQGFTVLNASGYVVAQRKAAVAAKITGRLDWLGVEEGSRVKAGQVLARLENRDVSASRAQAAANVETAHYLLDQARAERHDATLAYGRQKDLLSQGVVAQADFDAAEARYLRAKAAVSAAEWSLKGADAALRGADIAIDYTQIRAPFDAVVLTKNADVGDIVTPLGAAANAKAAVVTIADLGSLLVEADVSEANLGSVKPGQPCEIQLDALPDSRFRGAVHTIVPTADRSKASVLVKVSFVDRDSRILPEMSAKVAFLERPVQSGESRPKIAVNPAALINRGGRKVVFIVKGDRVIESAVTSGAPIGDLVEITSGVGAGEKVVLHPPDNLENGMKIKVAEKK
jgi:RND family efflux transporter MFP subunit